jgi:hypothetical protein
MAKWLVETSPIPSHPETAGAATETRTFMTDNAAKAFVREMVGKRRLVTVQTPPGTKPSTKMDHGEALRWAHD